ncbi:iron-containing redox enzyme family protein [Gordonia sp. HY285]|uniref:iron-containing redox enzyme family protein n=1 Tax=Gordonia liuliyuniae TaxID=2911517 RepID=UPI001F44383D|nr:iron-containing redox enzyme family protein [Gordonia liuliyuniae]MCF8611185.1 iron-containing redox enzyme family protein [Gordonia liuliyuniae]
MVAVSASRIGLASLPAPRGPVSEELVDAVRADSAHAPAHVRVPDDVDPWSDDVQLALTVCHELHYRGWVDAGRDCEWDPVVIAARVRLEEAFLDAVEQECPPSAEGRTADAELGALASSVPTGASEFLRRHGTESEFADYFAVRSLYHLKEADPHAWAIPRLRGQAKAAFVAVEFDEYGAGHGDRVHQELFADLLSAMGLNDAYLGYLSTAPALALAPVNLMSCLGLRRSRRGATVGHFAATEVTSPLGSARLLAGLERIGAPEEARRFYREHVEADAVHELVMRDQVVAPLLADEPSLEDDVLFGIAALQVVEDRLESALLDAWNSGASLTGV